MTRTTLGWASRCARAATTRRRRCCGTHSLRSCGGAPPLPSSVPSRAWWGCRRGSCGGWSASPTRRWPSSNAGAPSTSTRSSAWTRPPTAAVRPASPLPRAVHGRPARERPTAGRPVGPGALPCGRWRAGPICALGRATGRAQHHHRRRSGRGAVGRAGRRLHRQVRHQGHRELRQRPGPTPRGRRPGTARPAAGACGRAHSGRLGAGWPPRAGRAAAKGMGAHARVPGPLVDQEPPLLHHDGRAAAGPGRLRQAPPGQGRRAAGCLGPARGRRPGGDRRLLGVRRRRLRDRGGAVARPLGRRPGTWTRC